MKKVTPWSLLIVFGGLSILLVGVNQAAPDTPTADATKFADSLLTALGNGSGFLFMLVAGMLIAGWAFSSDGGGF
jgi:hypothetical protein